jgi:Family of unknown function (DUF6789)
LIRQAVTRFSAKRRTSLRLWTHRKEKKMRHHTVMRALEGGLLGTLLQTITVYGVMPLMLGRSVDPAAMLGHPCTVGLLAHVFSGGVLFPLAYVYLPSQGFPASPVLKGMLWAGLLWGVIEVIIAPMLGAGVFSAALGGFPAAGRALLGYLVYGAALGGIVGPAEWESRCASRAV